VAANDKILIVPFAAKIETNDARKLANISTTPTTTPANQQTPILTDPLKEILKNKDFCSYYNFREAHRQFTPEQEDLLAEHLYGSKNATKPNEEKFWTLEDYFTLSHGNISDALGPEKQTILHFYNALFLSNLLSGQATSPNLTRASEILTELKNRDPNNGAFPFMLAAVKQEMHAPQIEIDEDLQLAMQAEYFDIFQSSVLQAIFESGLGDILDLEVAVYLINISPTPNLNVSYKLLKNLQELEEKNKKLNPKDYEIGERISKLKNYCPASEFTYFFEKRRAKFLDYRQRHH